MANGAGEFHIEMLDKREECTGSRKKSLILMIGNGRIVQIYAYVNQNSIEFLDVPCSSGISEH